MILIRCLTLVVSMLALVGPLKADDFDYYDNDFYKSTPSVDTSDSFDACELGLPSCPTARQVYPGDVQVLVPFDDRALESDSFRPAQPIREKPPYPYAHPGAYNYPQVVPIR